MKFLVLALCVCAASAASFGSFNNYQPARKFAPVPTNYDSAPVLAAQAVASVASAPVVAVAKAAYETAKTAKNVYDNAQAVVLQQNSEVNPDGFRYGYETSNGITAEAVGSVKRVGDVDVQVVQGSYKYTSEDGTPVVFQYIADENGYQPQSDLLPVAPAIPEAIARSLEYIQAHTVVEPTKKF